MRIHKGERGAVSVSSLTLTCRGKWRQSRFFFASHSVVFFPNPGILLPCFLTYMSWGTDWDHCITRQSVCELAEALWPSAETFPSRCSEGTSPTKQHGGGGGGVHIMNWLVGIHLLLVKAEYVAETRIPLNLSHSVLTPGCQGGAPSYRQTFLQQASFPRNLSLG